MKRTRSRPAPRPTPGARPPRHRRGRALPVLALLVLVGVALWWFAPRPASRVQPDPVAALSPDSAYARALRMMRSGHSAASLPYFRRAVGTGSYSFATAHGNYAGAIYNALFEADTLAGHVAPRLRSSLARVQATRECLDQMLIAVRSAPTEAERARYCDRLGRMLNAWGFQWEALIWFEQAAQLDPGNDAYALHHDAMLSQLSQPERRLPALEDSAAAHR